MAALSWKPEWVLDIGSIDAQHQSILRTINTLQIIKSGPAAQSLRCKMLAVLQQYANIHFEYEEELLSDTGYPGLEELAAEHLGFISKLDQFKFRLAKAPDSDDVAEELWAYLCGWFGEHIDQSDRKFQAHLISAGIE